MDTDDPVEMYLRECAAAQPLTNEDEAAALEQYRRGGVAAEVAGRRLIESKLTLVVEIARRHASSGIPTLDLIQEGNLGLFRALQTFEPDVDVFSAHAASCVEEAITAAIRRKNAEKTGPSQS